MASATRAVPGSCTTPGRRTFPTTSTTSRPAGAVVPGEAPAAGDEAPPGPPATGVPAAISAGGATGVARDVQAHHPAIATSTTTPTTTATPALPSSNHEGVVSGTQPPRREGTARSGTPRR
jgi:hypothetical protein